MCAAAIAALLGVLRWAKRARAAKLTKSSIMVGIGETDDEVLETTATCAAWASTS